MILVNIGSIKIDIQAILAVAWMLSAVVLTLLLADHLGGRGWLWLTIHHIICLIGCTHEYFRYKKRQRSNMNNF